MSAIESSAALASRPSPEQVNLAFAQAVNRGDLQGASACFAKDACLLTPDATAIRGREDIRGILRQLIAAGTTIEVLSSTALVAGEVAFSSEVWRIRTTTGTGPTIEWKTTPTLVLRLSEEDWRLAIAAPWASHSTLRPQEVRVRDERTEPQ